MKLAKTAAVREFCGVGDIVVEIDGEAELVGRQSLKLLSAKYDGGNDRTDLMAKDLVKNYPYYYVGSTN